MHYQEFFFENHFADNAVYGLQGKLKHLGQPFQTDAIIRLSIGEDVGTQTLLLDLPGIG